MANSVSRTAARTATLVAVPIALLVGVLMFWLMGGFGSVGGRPAGSASAVPHPAGSVSMAASPLPEQNAVVCRAFLSQLPDRIRDRARRPVTAGPEQNAAYGDPPLRAACGGPAASLAPTATVYKLSQVCWYETGQGTDTVWTTVDRTVPVTVTVPAGYRSPGQWVAEFSDTIAGTVPSAAQQPAGCR